MSEGSLIEVVGRVRRDDGGWDDDVRLGEYAFGGGGGNQVVRGHDERTDRRLRAPLNPGSGAPSGPP